MTIIRNIKSIDKLAAIVIGLITDDKPNINNMLKVLDPNIFPRAMSFSPFLAATKEVTSSGREVPIATIVRPTNFSLSPNPKAIAEAESTTIFPPNIIPITPTIDKIIFLTVLLGDFMFCSSKSSNSAVNATSSSFLLLLLTVYIKYIILIKQAVSSKKLFMKPLTYPF